MALEDDLKNIDDNLKKLNLEGVQMESTFRNIGGIFNKLAQSAGIYSDEVDIARKTTIGLTKEADILAKLTKDDLKSKSKIKKLN